MYIPPHFAESDLNTLHDFIEQHSFGLLVSQHQGEPFVTHLPFLLNRTAGPNGALLGHVARQNPQWRDLVGQKVLAIFQGPHAYISPTWYQADKAVPTWNYVAVHAYGSARLIEDPAELVAVIRELTRRHEQFMPAPWDFDPAEPFVQKLATQIVAFRIEIERLEGKWKLNQNHPRERRERVVEALRQQRWEDARAIADLMDECSGVRVPGLASEPRTERNGAEAQPERNGAE
jgi:transcriptional regulator